MLRPLAGAAALLASGSSGKLARNRMFRVVSDLGAARSPSSIDERVLAWFAGERTDFTTRIMVAFTTLGDGIVLAVAVAVAAFVLVRARRITDARFVVLAGVCAGLATVVLKNSFARPRPDGLHLVAAGGYSFPSGHSLSSAAVYLSLALVGARSWPRHALAIWIGAGSLVCAIGVSRAYLGVHYPSDIVAGWACGAIVAFGSSFAVARAYKRPADDRR